MQKLRFIEMKGFSVPTCLKFLTPFLLAAALLTAAPARRATAQETSDPVAVGQKLYNSVGCWSCHGFSGQGAMSRGVAAGPRIDARNYPREAFFHQVRTPVRSMPPYSEQVLTDAQLDAIYQFLRSIPPARKVVDIPLLN
jgi:ubiquinol-cytochrome c reductase cytochrome c subunit